jgi:chromosome segregation ATPase
MDNQKFVNYYVDLLAASMNENAIRNIQLQANAKVTEEIITELNGKVTDLHNLVFVRDNRIKELELDVGKLNQQTQELNGEINRLNNMKGEFENTKHQLAHLDTFRNELIAARVELDTSRGAYNRVIEERDTALGAIVELNKAKENLESMVAKLQKENFEFAAKLQQVPEPKPEKQVIIPADTIKGKVPTKATKKDAAPLHDGGNF